MTNRAVFLSREGVLCQDAVQVSRPEDFRWLPGAILALRSLQEAHWRLVVVTHQPGIARGLVGPAEYDTLTGWMRSELAAQGVELDGVYHCPHLPDTPLVAWRRQCDCRFPKPGLLRRAARDLELDLTSSVMMGHRAEEIVAGRAARLAACVRVVERVDGLEVGPDHVLEDAAPTSTPPAALDPHADFSCASLAEAAYWLLDHQRELRA